MAHFRNTLKGAIIRKYGSVSAWTRETGVSNERFYNFLKGSYNPTLKTLETWLASVDLELAARKSRFTK